MTAPRLLVLALNPSLDYFVLLDRLTVGGLNRVTEVRKRAGGKGVNLARVASRCGLRVRVVGFLGQGGEPVLRALAEDGVEADFVPVPSSLRVNLKVHERTSGQVTEINEAGARVDGEALDALWRRLESALEAVDGVVATGSLPPGIPPDFYARVVRLARRRERFIALDADGPALSLGIVAAPHLVKPNRRELAELSGEGRSTADVMQAVRQARRVLAAGAGMVCASLDGDGALLVTPEGAWWARPPQIAEGDVAGAGDSLLAAFVASLLWGQSPVEALRQGVAAGTATVNRQGSDLCSLEELRAFLPRVAVERVV